MAWSQAILTAKGRELSAKALAGRLKLNFTEVWKPQQTLRISALRQIFPRLSKTRTRALAKLKL